MPQEKTNDKDKDDPKKDHPKKEKEEDTLLGLKSGMTVKVHEKIKDIDAKGKERTRVQIFEGIILAVKKAKTPSGTILVRKTSHAGVGVEKIFPIHSPLIDKIEVIKSIRSRRAKLYFLRDYKKRPKTTRVKNS